MCSSLYYLEYSKYVHFTQTAKSAFLGSAPQVLKDCELLINKRDQLRVSLFSAFAVSAETLNKVANLKPKSSFEAPNTLSKA